MNLLKVAALPLDIVWADIEDNIYAVGRALKKLDKDTDIVVLPELFSTGFISTTDLLHKFAEPAADSPTLKKIKEWAHQYNFAISGSLLVNQDNEIYNRGFFIEPSGEATFYDKVHLFNLSSEKKNFTRGKEQIPVVRYRGWNISLAVCYELRFPAWLRNVKNKYDLLIIPANWPASRAYAWQHLLIARAIENQAYVVGANRSGADDTGRYDFQSFIYNYKGKLISDNPDSPTKVISAVLDRNKLEEYRKVFPVAEDADMFKFI